MSKNIYLLVWLFTLLTFKGNAQQTVADSVTQVSFENATKPFYAALGSQSPLYNGPEYYFYEPIIQGTAYFQEVKSFTAGSVFYDGILYTNVPMLYDLAAEKIVVLLFNHFSKYSLLSERVKYFDFLSHHFIRIDADTLSVNSYKLNSGFYDVVYSGKTQALVKRSKSIQNGIGGASVDTYFLASTDYYIKKNNSYYKISNQDALVELFKDRKKEIQQYLKANQFKFRRDPENVLVKVTAYYDQLNSSK